MHKNYGKILGTILFILLISCILYLTFFSTKKINKGNIEVKIAGFLVKDWNNNWTGPLYTFLRAAYDKYVIRAKVDEYENRLTVKCETFIEQIKTYFMMEAKR